MTAARFKTAPLTDMVAVGLVSPRSVRLWLRSGRPGPVDIEWSRIDGSGADRTTVEITSADEGDRTAVVTLPGGAGRDFVPRSRYRFRVEHAAGQLLGEGEFETPPEASDPPSGFCFAVLSCHQPFDEAGAPLERATRMLEAARECLAERGAKYVLMVGDQMYADFPAALSLFDQTHFATVAPAGRRGILDCTAAEIRRLYQERYRVFWNEPAWKKLQSDLPCYPILDDHDLVDNWGSRDDRSTEGWRALGEGARAAYYDYQGSRVLDLGRDGIPASFHFSFEWGPTATFVFDLRSSRTPGPEGRLFASDQQADFEAFLARQRDTPVIFLVLSVPIVHVPRTLARICERLPIGDAEDFSDRWSSSAHCRDRDHLLVVIERHQSANPQQRVVLLSGDIHIGCAHVIQWRGTANRLYHFVSSPVTHATSALYATASRLMMRMRRTLRSSDGRRIASIRLVEGERRGQENPCCRLNIGMIEVDATDRHAGARLRFDLYGLTERRLARVYRSCWV
jgi:alkaline phosphatase D